MMRRLARSASIVVVAAAGACAPVPAATQSPGSLAPATVPAAATPGAPSQTAAPAVTKRFTFGTDVVASTQLAGTEDLYINPGAVIEADGMLHMFPNLFSKWPGRVTVPHLTSSDGLAWKLDSESKAIDSENVELADPGIDVSSGYIADDGTWVLIYQSVSSTNPWVISRATAPAPEGPWTVEDTPILSPGPDGAFDHGGVMWPSIVKVGDRYTMFYAGSDQAGSRKTAIGVAFSDDGVRWTRQEAPVLAPSEGWELGALDRPRVTATPSGLVMVYAGLDLNNRGLATSADGLVWTKVPGPALEQSGFPVQGGSWDCALLYRNGELEYFLEIGTRTTSVYRGTLAWP